MKYNKKHKIVSDQDTFISLPTGSVKVGVDSVGTSHISSASTEEFIKEFRDAAKKDLFGPVIIKND